MSKDAQTAYPVADFIAQRWSPRVFSSKEVSNDALGSLFEAARWSASCFNEQPWRYIVGNGPDSETYKKILECLVPFNQGWAASAPVLMLSVASTKFSSRGKKGQLNRHGVYDLGQATGALSAQATSMGLYLHQMGGFSVEAAREAFNIPEDFDPLAAIALGYMGAEEDTEPRVRHPLESIAFKGTWGESWQA